MASVWIAAQQRTSTLLFLLLWFAHAHPALPSRTHARTSTAKLLSLPAPQVARTMAPSVIYIDEAEKVFLTDKKKLKEFGSQVRVVGERTGTGRVTHTQLAPTPYNRRHA
jgi:hypothetical protein